MPDLPSGNDAILCYDFDIGIVRKRLPGLLPFDVQLGRDASDPSQSDEDTPALGPGYYDVSHTLVEAAAQVTDFSKASYWPGTEVRAQGGVQQHYCN